MKMDVYITLDYELFLGSKTGSPENCLVRPMDELCKVADKHGFKYVIFVDAAYLLRMNQLMESSEQLQGDYKVVSEHIKQLHDQGHNIQLHFHPQWLYSDYDNEAHIWHLDMRHYKLSDMETQFAFDCFRDAKQLLDGIIGKKTHAFRAGGFCLDTFHDFALLFNQNGITADSSVARNRMEKSPTHVYDYRKVPSKTIYRFSDSLVAEDVNGVFTEYSISSFSCSFLDYITSVRKKLRNYNPSVVFKDGISTAEVERVSFISRLLEYLKGKTYLASIDGMSSQLLSTAYLRNKKTGMKQMVLLGHPKLTTDSSASNLDLFISKYIYQISVKSNI